MGVASYNVLRYFDHSSADARSSETSSSHDPSLPAAAEAIWKTQTSFASASDTCVCPNGALSPLPPAGHGSIKTPFPARGAGKGGENGRSHLRTAEEQQVS